MDLFDYLLILNDDIAKHEIESMTSFYLETFTAFFYHFQYLWYQLSLVLHVSFEYRFAIAKHVALLVVIELLQEDQAPVYLC